MCTQIWLIPHTINIQNNCWRQSYRNIRNTLNVRILKTLCSQHRPVFPYFWWYQLQPYLEVQIIFYAWQIPVVWNVPYEALVVGMEVVQLMKVSQKMQIYHSGLNLDCFQNPRNIKQVNLLSQTVISALAELKVQASRRIDDMVNCSAEGSIAIWPILENKIFII